MLGIQAISLFDVDVRAKLDVHSNGHFLHSFRPSFHRFMSIQVVWRAAGAGSWAVGTPVVHAPPFRALPATMEPDARVRAPGGGSNGKSERDRAKNEL